MDPSDPATLYAGTTKGLFVTRDAGRSWKQLISGVVVNAVAVHPNQPSLILVGSDDAGILRSDDGGATFSPSNRGFVHRQIGALESIRAGPTCITPASSWTGVTADSSP